MINLKKIVSSALIAMSISCFLVPSAFAKTRIHFYDLKDVQKVQLGNVRYAVELKDYKLEKTGDIVSGKVLFEYGPQIIALFREDKLSTFWTAAAENRVIGLVGTINGQNVSNIKLSDEKEETIIHHKCKLGKEEHKGPYMQAYLSYDTINKNGKIVGKCGCPTSVEVIKTPVLTESNRHIWEVLLALNNEIDIASFDQSDLKDYLKKNNLHGGFQVINGRDVEIYLDTKTFEEPAFIGFKSIYPIESYYTNSIFMHYFKLSSDIDAYYKFYKVNGEWICEYSKGSTNVLYDNRKGLLRGAPEHYNTMAEIASAVLGIDANR